MERVKITGTTDECFQWVADRIAVLEDQIRELNARSCALEVAVADAVLTALDQSGILSKEKWREALQGSAAIVDAGAASAEGASEGELATLAVISQRLKMLANRPDIAAAKPRFTVV